jgi:dihydroxy-acid dehydratase
VKVNAALGGSTNAVVHLLALAGRVGVPLALEDFDQIARDVPVLANLKPSGSYLMEDFYYAGGLPALMARMADLLHLDVVTVSGRTVAQNILDAPCWNDDVISSLQAPFLPAGNGTAVLKGNLAPNGAVLKISAASPHLLTHEGPALVFDRIEDYAAVSDDPDLAVTPDTVLVVRNCGPRGYPGFPEVGNMPLPRILLEAGITDMVRISDARMSGTGFGTCVLHVAPESAVGGPLALVRTGDTISLDVAARRLDVLIDVGELHRRAEETSPPPAPGKSRGWTALYIAHVLQADRGADLDFLVGGSGPEPPRQSH